jgi:hypothetical protein
MPRSSPHGWEYLGISTLIIVFGCLGVVTEAQDNASAPPTNGQVDLKDIARHLLGRPEPDDAPSEGRTVSILPTIGVSPLVGVAFGVLLSSADSVEGTSSALSLLNVSASYSTKGQLLLAARADRHFKSGQWRLFGDWRLYDLTDRTYGLGSGSSTEAEQEIGYVWIRSHTTFLRAIGGGLYVGPGYYFDRHQFDRSLEVIGGRATQTSGVSIDALYDSRDNAINASKGLYGHISFHWMPEELGSDRASRSVETEGRSYWRLPFERRHVLAGWFVGSFGLDGIPPYFDLPANGWDTYGRTGRGYRPGRFRGRDWVYGELEYRTDLMTSGLLGLVAFANISTLSDVRGALGPWQPAGGAGLRIKMDKRHGTNISIDYGWGTSGSRGLFAALNEAF